MSTPMTNDAYLSCTTQDEAPAYTRSPTFIPLALEELEAGLSEEKIELLRSKLSMKALYRELGRLMQDEGTNA